MKKLKLIIGLLSSCLLLLRCGSPETEYQTRFPEGKVHIEYGERGFELMVEGEPFEIRGVVGETQLEELVAIGGNTIRIWDGPHADSIMDRAEELGLKVFFTINLLPQWKGMDYNKPEATAEQNEYVMKRVHEIKDHPALLIWCLGNELDLFSENPKVWESLSELADMIRAVDPNHPITTTLSGNRKSPAILVRHWPSIDLLSLNVYAKLELVPGDIADLAPAWIGPYLISEWGSRGYWEVGISDWKAPCEEPSNQKLKTIDYLYRHSMGLDTAHCLGGYLFHWGEKQERTDSWFSIRLKGLKTPEVDMISKIWTGSWPENRSPLVENMQFIDLDDRKDNAYLEPGQTYYAHVLVSDPEGDPLSYEWVLKREGSYFDSFGGAVEPAPVEYPDLILDAMGDVVEFRSPEEEGPYRLFVYVRDGQGNIGTANGTIYVMRSGLY